VTGDNLHPIQLLIQQVSGQFHYISELILIEDISGAVFYIFLNKFKTGSILMIVGDFLN